MVERIKKPSTPSNYAKNKVDDQISLAQQTEERWLQSVIINSRLVFNRKSFSTSTAARSPATRGCYCCASLTTNWRSPRSFEAYLTTGAIRGSSNTTLIKCSVRESIRSPQATRTAMTRTCCETILPFRPSSANPILWPLSPRSRGWRITPTGRASGDLASLVLSGLSSTVTTREKLPKKSYWTQTPPTIHATASKCSPFFTANTASTCITRCFSSKPKPAVCSRPAFAPAMPRLQRGSPLSLRAWCPSLDGAFLKARSATAPMLARPLQKSMSPWNPSKSSMRSVSAPTQCFNEKPSAGLSGPNASMPAATKRSEFFIALDTEPEAGPNTEKLWPKSKSVLWAPICALSLPTERAEPNTSLTTTTIADSARIGSKSLNAIFTPSGYPATAIAPMPFGFNSTRSPTSCWCSFVFMRLKELPSPRFGWKPYDLSCSKWAPALSAALAACGFISPLAGPDAICSWKFGKNFDAYPELRPAKFRSLSSHHGYGFRHSRLDVPVFFQNAFFPRPTRQAYTFSSPGLDIVEKIHLP